MDRYVLGQAARVSRSQKQKTPPLGYPHSKKHILDHLNCAFVLARQERMELVSYLVQLAIAALEDAEADRVLRSG